MEVILAKSAGFCPGVQRAVNMVYEQTEIPERGPGIRDHENNSAEDSENSYPENRKNRDGFENKPFRINLQNVLIASALLLSSNHLREIHI